MLLYSAAQILVCALCTAGSQIQKKKRSISAGECLTDAVGSKRFRRLDSAASVAGG
jgi:hypothetical protein